MSLFKDITGSMSAIIKAATKTTERTLTALDYVVESGELMAKELRDDTQFDCAKNTKSREAEMSLFEKELDKATQNPE